MGLGADIISTLQWPVLGDPFALVSLLFPMAALETAFATMYVLRMLVAGVAAALYFRVMGAKPPPSAMGAVAYVFTTFLFIQGRHPYFINAMVFSSPILLMSLEWALHNRRRWVLVAVVFVTVAANFYFFYILTIVAVIYAVARYFELAEKEERWKRLLPTALRVGGYYTLGVILSGTTAAPCGGCSHADHPQRIRCALGGVSPVRSTTVRWSSHSPPAIRPTTPRSLASRGSACSRLPRCSCDADMAPSTS